MSGEKKVASQTVFQGKILQVRRDEVVLPDGRPSAREVVETTDAVAVVGITGAGEVLMVKQYRYAVARALLEIPAGKIEPGEKPLECARRELEEETGYRASAWREMYSFYTSPGFCTEKIYLFMAADLTLAGQKLDRDEFIDVVKVPLPEALQMAARGELVDAKTIVGLLAAAGKAGF